MLGTPRTPGRIPTHNALPTTCCFRIPTFPHRNRVAEWLGGWGWLNALRWLVHFGPHGGLVPHVLNRNLGPRKNFAPG